MWDFDWWRRISVVNMHTDLNIPICAFSTILVVLFLHLKTPPATLKEKVSKMDIM
jgi:hypothetical protein